MKNPNRRQKHRLKTIVKTERLNTSLEQTIKHLEKLAEQFKEEYTEHNKRQN